MKISGTSTINGVSKSSPSYGKAESAAAPKKEEKVDKAIAGNEVRYALTKASDVDMSEVERVRKAIAEGTLKMDSQSLAKAVLELHQS